MNFYVQIPFDWQKIMRITCSQLLIAIAFTCMAYANDSMAQHVLDRSVNLSVKQVSLQEALTKLESAGQVKFVYSENVISTDRLVSIETKGAPLQKVLDKLLRSYGVSYSVINDRIVLGKTAENTATEAELEVVVSASPTAQLSLSGKVTDDETGEALPGVNVILKDSNIGVSTDAYGNYKLTIPESAAKGVLVFSFIGYDKKEVAIDNQLIINVTLVKDIKDLNEVVVVGYGIQKKGTLTGSVAQINGDQLKQAPAMNVSNLLAGRLPGLITVQTSGRPGNDDAALRIRGLGTMGDNAPTVIVDGVQRSFFNLDPNEIESISILKDAAAAAVYGFQGANGVILVTTKRGKNGGKPTISYSTSVTMNSNTRLPKFLNGPDYMQWYRKAEELDNQYRIETGADPIPYTYSQEQIDALRNGTNTNPYLGNTDWIGKLAGNNSFTQHHNVSVSGGTEKVKYFSTLGYLDQDGVVKNTNFKRYNLRTNLDVEFNKVLSAAMDIGARMENTGTPGIPPDNVGYANAFSQAAAMLPNLPEYTPDGIPTASGWVNPLASVEKSGYQKINNGVFQGSMIFKLRIPPIKGLEIKLLTSYDRTFSEQKSWMTPYTLAQRSMGGNGWVWTNILPTGISTSSLQQVYSTNFRTTFQPSINYMNTWGNHSVTGLLLYEYSKYNDHNFYARAQNFSLLDIQELSKGSSAAADLSQPGGSSSTNARAGYVGRFNYAFKEKYLAEIVARYDGSVNFPKENRWGLFPAVSLGWVLSKEAFFEDLSGRVSFLKLKGSLGKLGNDRIGQFRYLQTFSLPRDPVTIIGGQPVKGLLPGSPPNPNITWETATITNVGFETSLWNGLLNVDFDWFYKVTKGILMPQYNLFPPSMGGYFADYFNAGIVDNRGVDLQISHRKTITNKLNYAVTGNFNWAHNKIIRRDVPVNAPEWQVGIGRSIGQKFGFVADGLFQNWEEVNNWATSPSGSAAPGLIRYKDLNGDGQIKDGDDMTFIGRSNTPEIMYGLNLQVNYGIFDFSALFQGAALSSVSLGGTYEGDQGVPYGLQDNTSFSRTFYNGNSPYYLVEQAWTPDNPNANYPRLTTGNIALPNHNGWSNSFFVKNGAYLRLKSVQVGVSLKPELLKKMKFQQVRLYVSGFNLITWDHLKYMDPEMPNVNNGFYPQQRMLSLGLNLTF